MGFGVVDIRKISEAGELVTYAYEHEGRGGKFTINRKSGEILDIGTPTGTAAFAAQHKIRKAWRTGELPDRATWAG